MPTDPAIDRFAAILSRVALAQQRIKTLEETIRKHETAIASLITPPHH
jgi:hypothetical protein